MPIQALLHSFGPHERKACSEQLLPIEKVRVVNLPAAGTHHKLWLNIWALLHKFPCERLHVRGSRILKQTCMLALTSSNRSVCPNISGEGNFVVDTTVREFGMMVNSTPLFGARWTLDIPPISNGWPPPELVDAEHFLDTPSIGAKTVLGALPTTVCTKEPGDCDEYSKGTGRCRVWHNFKEVSGVVARDNCNQAGMHNWEWPHPGLMFCPLDTRIAVRYFSKCGSSSTLKWLAVLERRRSRDFELYASTWSTKGEAKSDWMAQWVLDPATKVGVSLQSAKTFAGLAEPYWNGEMIVLPGSRCFTCCRHGYGRIRVAVVRNPYTRLVSGFAFFHQIRQLRDLNMPLADRFALFLDFVIQASWVPNKTAHGKQRLRFLSNGKWYDIVTNRLDLAIVQDHAWPLHEELRGAHKLNEFHLIHLERSTRDLNALSARLCMEFGDCSRLPGFPKLNVKGKMRADDVIDYQMALPAILQRREGIVRRYREDFRCCGYSEDPRRVNEVIDEAELGARYE